MSAQFNNYINGEWRDGVALTRNINPSDTSDIIGEYAKADIKQTEEAINAARVAFASWRYSGIQQRFDSLDFIGTEILARKKELGELLSREEGKTLKEGIGEVARAGQIFKFYAGECLRLVGEVQDSVRVGLSVETTREAIGVTGIITPWNFPIAIPAWKIAPALAYGNCVVFKPAELVLGSAHALSDIISRAGLPKGVFNLVMGAGREVGNTIVESKAIDAISFTGSVATGKAIAEKSIATLKKLQLEMGGKNPLVILDDADLNTAVECATQGAFYSTGQRCTASSRLIVTEGIHDRFVTALVERLKKLNVDHALKPETDMGPVVNQQQLNQDLDYIKIGQSEGAQLIFGGDCLNRKTTGFYLQPALFTETTSSMRINREEIFGPVASVIRVKNYEEALIIANESEFGLSSGIITQSLKYATHYKQHAAAGMVMVNVPTAGVDYHVAFGGSKASSYGSREQGMHAREFYTRLKTSYISA